MRFTLITSLATISAMAIPPICTSTIPSTTHIPYPGCITPNDKSDIGKRTPSLEGLLGGMAGGSSGTTGLPDFLSSLGQGLKELLSHIPAPTPRTSPSTPKSGGPLVPVTPSVKGPISTKIPQQESSTSGPSGNATRPIAPMPGKAPETPVPDSREVSEAAPNPDPAGISKRALPPVPLFKRNLGSRD